MVKILAGVFLLLCASALWAVEQDANRVERFYLAKVFSELTLSAKQQSLFEDAAAVGAKLKAKCKELGELDENKAAQADRVINAVLNGEPVKAGDVPMRNMLTQGAEAIFKTADQEFSASILRAADSLTDQQIVSLLSLQQKWQAATARTQALSAMAPGKWEEEKESMVGRMLAASGAALYFESPTGSAMIPVMGDTARFVDERNRAIESLDRFRLDSNNPALKLAITRAFFASMVDPRTLKRELEFRVRGLVAMAECGWVLEHLKVGK